MGLAFFLAIGIAHAQPWEVEDLPLDAVQRLGRELYEQDAYVARATDLLFAQTGGPERLAQEGLQGAWVVTRTKGATIVRFIKEAQGETAAAYEVVFRGSSAGRVRKPVDGRLSEADLAQLRARRLALSSVRDRCSERYNTVVVRQNSGGDLLVYALAVSAEAGKMMVGGHYRITVTPDGQKIVKVEKLFRSCLTLRIGDSPDGIPWVTHVVSARPLETHIYLSLLHQRKLYVGAGDAIWKIEAGTISHVEPSR